MTPTLFVIYETEAEISPDDIRTVTDTVEELPSLTGGRLLTPITGVGDQPFAADGRGPALALQLDFADETGLRLALRSDSRLADLAHPAALPSLAAASVTHQPMLGRRFPVATPDHDLPADALPCTFLVQYLGTAQNLPAWLDHYDANHPPIMVRFPGIREVMTFRPVETWESALPWNRGAAMQRNKVVFDSTDALVAALASPVMAEMRADGAAFPPYHPRAVHHPMATRILQPGP